MTPELTPGQKRLFDYLKTTIERTGTAPSLRQAAGDLGISHAAVSQGLKLLEQKGGWSGVRAATAAPST